MAPRQRELPADPHGRRIVKALDQITATGIQQDDVFEDWLELVEATFQMMPAHAASARSAGRLAKDSPEVLDLFTRLRKRYGDRVWVWERFVEAFGILVEGAYDGGQPTYQDLLGQVYMAWGWPSRSAGQYFTPWPIARAMAEMTGDGGQLVHDRLKAAIAQSPLAQAALVTAVALRLEGQEALDWYLQRVVPACIEHYEPVTVSDPAVGSGVMLLACASTYPRWMIELGLVRFSGQDIDATCVRMCRINCMLYGLNSHALRVASALARAGDPAAEPVNLSLGI